METLINIVANRLKMNIRYVHSVVDLIEDGATIPFIARYRKEASGGMDEVAISSIADEYSQILEIQKRKQTILTQIGNSGKLSDELRKRIENTWDQTELEDIYLPYKPKRRTRAQMAREAGLEPLALIIQSGCCGQPILEAKRFLNEKITDEKQALEGARDIIAETISEHETARNIVRQSFERTAVLTSKVIKGKEDEGANYTDYFDKQIRLKSCASHTLLAMRRGENEKILRVKIETDDEQAIGRLEKRFIHCDDACRDEMKIAIADGYKRLLRPSIETEFAAKSKARADDEAIAIFSTNLRQLLLSSPLGQKHTMGIDPGFRTGCKVVCLDTEGKLLHHDVIYPHPPANRTSEAKSKLVELANRYNIEAIAVGNGTAGRETEQLLNSTTWGRPVDIYLVSENGASIYSASEIARSEFPDHDITVRGAVSIGRRLMDPLSELVKIDPKSIGVGQYQHDVDQTALKRALDQTVEWCVNSVGIELNNASEQLLMYIAGIGPQIAKNIVSYRSEHGSFKNRKELMAVPKLGKKAYEQCAGFIRVRCSSNPLDRTAVHPERYHVVEQMAEDLGCSVEQLIGNQTLREQINIDRYTNETVGLPTLRDIMSELEKPGRDPRGQKEHWGFNPNIRTIEDLREGMELDGEVTNITNFGAFVNIGIKENGLIHISQISDKRISSPTDVLNLQQHIRVKILSIDIPRRRIQLSMRNVGI